MPTIARDERGAAAVEFALVLPLLMTLVFGIVSFGQAYNAKLGLTHAAREAARTVAISGDVSDASAATLAAAPGMSGISVSTSPASGTCTPGLPVTVTATKPFTIDIPLLPSASVTLTGKGVMQCGG